jgi:transposase-like protein
MLGFKSFRSAKITLAGIESVRMIKKVKFKALMKVNLPFIILHS